MADPDEHDARLQGPSGLLGTANANPINLPNAVSTARTTQGLVFNPISTATGQLQDVVRGQAINRICNYLHIESDQVEEGLDLISLTGAALGGNVKAIIDLGTIIVMSVVDAMLSQAKISYTMSAAHTFGYWLSNGQARCPIGLPQSRRVFRQEEDALGDDGVSAMEWGNRWTAAHMETLRALDASIDMPAARNMVQQTFGSAVGPEAFRNPQLVRAYAKTIMARDFNHNYSAAAAVFFADRIKSFSRVQKDNAIIAYRGCPYRA